VKLSKASWIFIVIGIILIAAVGLGMSRSQQTDQMASLTDQLAQSKQKLALVKNGDLITQKNELTRQLEQYTAQSESARKRLLFSEDSISATDVLLASAAGYRLTVVNMSSPGESANNLGGMKCTSLPVSLQVEGNIHDITNFICNLSVLFPSSTVKTLQLTALDPASASPPEAAPESSPVIESPSAFEPEKNTSASISVVIYNYKE
jgi:hypothetical protein